MRAVITTCTADKSDAPALIPAWRRYRGPRIDHALAMASRSDLPLLFLSGEYGVITADHPLPWYDHALQPHEVTRLVGTVTRQLTALRLTHLTALLLPRRTPGWAPYYEVLAASCEAAGVAVAVETLDAPRLR